MSTDDFDWSPLGESFWRSAAESCQHKPSELQLRFACLKHSGLNATDSARGAGYQANDDEGMRQQGSRAAKTTAVCERLAYAHAETGKGDDGIVSGKEAKRILSRISRKGNNNERIKALEALSRLDQVEAAASANQPEESPEQSLAFIIAAVPTQGLGAYLALCSFVAAGGPVCNFPFIAEIAPTIARNYPGGWAKWTAKGHMTDFLCKLADAPVLSDDELVAAVRAKLGPVKTLETGNAN
jgi:hypothetical protein